MPFTHSVVGIRPPARYDNAFWTSAALLESATSDGAYGAVEVFALAAYADPTAPPSFSFTSSAFTLERVWLKVEFRDDEGGIIRSQPILSPDPSAAGYPSAEELLAQSTVPELQSLTMDQLESLRQSSIAAIEDYCGQSFLPEDNVTREVFSNGGAELFLPKRLRSFTEVGSLELGAIYVTPEGDKLYFRRNTVGVGYYEQALFEVSGGDYAGSFPRDTLLAISGDWGWDTVPEGVRLAIRYDMEDQAVADANALASTVHSFRALGLTSVSQGNLRAELGVLPALSARVTRVLAPFLFLGQGGRLV